MTGHRGLRETIRDVIDPALLMRRIVASSAAFLPHAEGAAIDLLDAGGVLTCVSGEGLLERLVGSQVRPQSLAGQALRSGQVLRCDDVERDRRVDRVAARQLGIGSLVCVPLVHGTTPVGVLTVCAAAPGAFGDRDVAALGELAGFVSAVVRSASEVASSMPWVRDLLGTGSRAGTQPADQVGAGEVDQAGGPVRSGRAAETDPAAGSDPAVEAVELFVAGVLRPNLVGAVEARRRVEAALTSKGFTMVFQPVLHLPSGGLMAVEALARFPGPPDLPPDVWFADAERAGLGVELELAAVELALAALPELPEALSMGVNVGPAAICAPALLQLVEAAGPRRVIVELTEHRRIDDYGELLEAPAKLRRTGARLSVDDTGSGYSSLAHIINLSPDIIKLDLALTRGIDADPVRYCLAQALVTFARQAGAVLVAEGVETAGELHTLRQLGIEFGQGFHLGRPGPIGNLLTTVG